MDAVAGLLDGPRARGAFLLRSLLDPPWCLRIQDEAPLTLLAVVRGDGWLLPDGAPPSHLVAGDVAVLRGPEAYSVADQPDTPVHVVIDPGQRCTTVGGAALTSMSELGVRTWGNSPYGETVLLTGTYQLRSEVSRRLLAALPATLVLRGDEWDNPLVGYLADEVGRDAPGQEGSRPSGCAGSRTTGAPMLRWSGPGQPGRRSDDRARGAYVGQQPGRRARPADRYAPAAQRGEPAAAGRAARDPGPARRRVREPVGGRLADEVARHSPGQEAVLDRLRTCCSSRARPPFALSAAFKRTRGISPAQHRATA